MRKEAAVIAPPTPPTARTSGHRRMWLIPLLVLVASACGSTTPTAAPTSQPAPGSAGPPSVASTSPGSAPPASILASVPPAVSPGPSAGGASPIDPANFVAVVDNPWFPLIPGTVFTYRGTKDGQAAVDTFTVTSDTKVVAGVTCTVIHDRLTLDGALAETTDDWYVQDRAGNVWYFGEATQELENGKVVNTDGSWETGVDGAQPGIFMPAQPVVGLSGVQEVYPGQAEDHYVVLLTDAKVKVPLATYSGVLLTAEWTPLEPDVLSEKAYVKGLGEAREADVAGGDETLALTKVVKP
jgi:hypothetical protein